MVCWDLTLNTSNPYDENHWIKKYLHNDFMLTKNAFVKINTSGETAEEKIKKSDKQYTQIVDALKYSYEKTMLEKEKNNMNEKQKRMHKFKKGDAVNTDKGPGYIVAFSYNTGAIGVRLDDAGFRGNRLVWCDPMMVERDYTRMNKTIINTLPTIKNVVFNDPLTIVIWEDGTKTYVKASGNDTFNPEKGMALAIAKRAMGNTYGYFETIREWVEKDQKRKEKLAKKETHIHPEEERIYFDLSGEEPKVIGNVVEKDATDEGVTAKVELNVDGREFVSKLKRSFEKQGFHEEDI